MSAECEKHGCDLVGHQFGEGGIQCPQCVLDAEVERLRTAFEQIQVVEADNQHGPAWAAAECFAIAHRALTPPAAVEERLQAPEEPSYEYAVIDLETGETCLIYEEFDALRHDIEWPAPDGSIRRRVVGEWERMTPPAEADSE